MLELELTADTFTHIKDTLRVSIPDVATARRNDAAARGLGSNSNAALRASLAKGPRKATVDGAAFARALPEAGDGADRLFVAACGVQAIRQALAETPDLAFGPLVALLEPDPETWASPEARVAAEDFIALDAQLRKASFLRKVGRYPSALAIANAAPKRTKGIVRVPAAIAAALHVGLPLLPDHLWEGSIPAFLVVPAQPGTEVPYPAWVGRLLARGEITKDKARDAVRASVAAGFFDMEAAEILVKALWCRAFGNHLDQEGLPDWRAYGRMLLADPGLGALGLARDEAAYAERARAGMETLCGGGPLPGLRQGYTHVFEGELGALLDKSDPLGRSTRTAARDGAGRSRRDARAKARR